MSGAISQLCFLAMQQHDVEIPRIEKLFVATVSVEPFTTIFHFAALS